MVNVRTRILLLAGVPLLGLAVAGAIGHRTIAELDRHTVGFVATGFEPIK